MPCRPGDYSYNSNSNHNHNEATGNYYTYTKQSRVPAPDFSALVQGEHDTGMIPDRIMNPDATRRDAVS